MRSILIQLDDATFEALKRIAPVTERRRTEFIRQAVREAIRRHEYDRMREAYLAMPDSAAADDWQNAEEFKV